MNCTHVCMFWKHATAMLLYVCLEHIPLSCSCMYVCFGSMSLPFMYMFVWEICRAVLITLEAPGQSNALVPIPTQSVT